MSAMPATTHPLESCQTDPLIPAPIKNSYWATPLLCASEYPFSPGQPQLQLDKLLKAGIRTFIDLTEPHELLPYEYHLRTRARAVGIPDTEQLWYYRFPIRDRSTPSGDGQTMLGIMAVLQVCHILGRDGSQVHRICFIGMRTSW
jgi:atypical dual specificity phosphatase